MKIAGLNVIQVFGLINLFLVFFQLLTGLRVIKVSFLLHRRSGIALCFFASVHAILAFIAGL